MSTMPCSWDDPGVPTGSLDLYFHTRNEITHLVRQRFSGLLRASRPVYRGNSSTPEIQIIHLGPGSMSGDVYHQRVHLGADAGAHIEYQSFAKVLPGAEGCTQHVVMNLERGSLLSMGSNVIVPFPQSKYTARLDIHLAEQAVALVPEILMTRQSDAWQSLDILRMKSTVRVFQQCRLVLRDHLDFGLESMTGGRAWTQGYPVLGNLYLLGIPSNMEVTLQTVCNHAMEHGVHAGVSAIQGTGFVMRMLGSRVQDIQNIVNRTVEVCSRRSCVNP